MLQIKLVFSNPSDTPAHRGPTPPTSPQESTRRKAVFVWKQTKCRVGAVSSLLITFFFLLLNAKCMRWNQWVSGRGWEDSHAFWAAVCRHSPRETRLRASPHPHAAFAEHSGPPFKQEPRRVLLKNHRRTSSSSSSSYSLLVLVVFFSANLVRRERRKVELLVKHKRTHWRSTRTTNIWSLLWKVT